MANEKQTLIDALKKYHDAQFTPGVYVHSIFGKAAMLLEVDAVEVVHGHWCWEGRFKACSICGSYVEWDETLGANFWKFCPYCGAKMDGGKDNANNQQ